jgi:protein Mpv17
MFQHVENLKRKTADSSVQGFWPLAISGLKLWPLVSLLNLTIVPVNRRVVVGSLVGLFWGIYVSLIISEDSL